MTGERVQTTLLLLLMLAVGAGAWWLQWRPAPRVDPGPLAALPLEVGPWQGRDIPLEDAVERILQADHHVQRVYARENSGEIVWLYIGYYGTHRGGRPEHTPEVCYPSAGWSVEARESPGLGARDDDGSVMLLVAQDGRRRLVEYWYRSPLAARRAHRLDLSLDQLRGRLRGGRADGALVRLSTPVVAGGEAAAAARLADLGRRLDPLLEKHWPVERPADAGS